VEAAEASADSHHLSPERVAEMLASGDVQLIDVREPYEWEAGRVANARHILFDQLPALAETIDRDRPVVFVCRGGSRSGMAADAFRQSGFDAHNMEGGLRAWADRGLPVEPDGGEIAESRPDAS
jgi:rhodanese-related sulfurtransferase